MNSRVAVLFARQDSIYKEIEGCDVYDKNRDARSFSGGASVIAHPPCRGWGQLRMLANPEPGEKELGLFASDTVRVCGGVLEHPARSTLWEAANLPYPGDYDEFGGFTVPVDQFWWGHRARKRTWLYVVGLDSISRLPEMPFALGEASHIVGSSGRRRDGSRLHKGDIGWRPEVTKAEREGTPQELAVWLVNLARLCDRREVVA